MNIDWTSDENYIFSNNRLKNKEFVEHALSSAANLKGHIWVATSGTTLKGSKSKWVALSKKALLASAASVNKHMECVPNDKWLLALPTFHVGGLSIFARSQLLECEVINLQKWQEKWKPEIFVQALKESKATLSALVPTQLYDLVRLNLSPNKELRALVIGGSSLNRHLYKEARNLGWNILPSYGLTECSSQVATAELKSLSQDSFPKLKLLDHVEIQVNAQGCISIKSPSLFTVLATLCEKEVIINDPKVEGVYTTEDQGVIQGRYLQVKGRAGDVVKISGENVDMSKLQHVLDTLKLELKIKGEHVLAAIPDDRLGASICLVSTSFSKEEALSLKQAFNELVMPFERIREEKKIRQIPRNPLGKVLQASLLKMLICQLV